MDPQRAAELRKAVEEPVRLFRFARAYHDKLRELYETGPLMSFLDSTIYGAVVDVLEEQLKPYAYNLVVFVTEVLEEHPELFKEPGNDQARKVSKRPRHKTRAPRS